MLLALVLAFILLTLFLVRILLVHILLIHILCLSASRRRVMRARAASRGDSRTCSRFARFSLRSFTSKSDFEFMQWVVVNFSTCLVKHPTLPGPQDTTSARKITVVTDSTWTVRNPGATQVTLRAQKRQAPTAHILHLRL